MNEQNDSIWEFDAPKFHDFTQLPMIGRTEAEAYFLGDHENGHDENVAPKSPPPERDQFDFKLTDPHVKGILSLLDSPGAKHNRRKASVRTATPYKPKPAGKRRSFIQTLTPRRLKQPITTIVEENEEEDVGEVDSIPTMVMRESFPVVERPLLVPEETCVLSTDHEEEDLIKDDNSDRNSVEIYTMPKKPSTLSVSSISSPSVRPLTNPEPFTFSSEVKSSHKSDALKSTRTRKPTPKPKSKAKEETLLKSSNSPMKITTPKPFTFSSSSRQSSRRSSTSSSVSQSTPKPQDKPSASLFKDFTLSPVIEIEGVDPDKTKRVRKFPKQSRGLAGVPRVHKRELTKTKEFRFTNRSRTSSVSSSRDSSAAPSTSTLSSRPRRPKSTQPLKEPLQLTVPKPFTLTASKSQSKAKSSSNELNSKSKSSFNELKSQSKAKASFTELKSQSKATLSTTELKSLSKAKSSSAELKSQPKSSSTELKSQPKSSFNQLNSQSKAKASFNQLNPKFKAKPQSTSSTRSAPVWTGITIPEPFYLLTEIRGQEYQRQFRKMVEAELISQERMFGSFRARSVPDFRPFHPVLGQSSLTYPTEFQFRSEGRIRERQRFREMVEEKQRERSQRALENERLVRQMERFKLEADSHARREQQTLTIPQSPMFPTNSRFGRKSMSRH